MRKRYPASLLLVLITSCMLSAQEGLPVYHDYLSDNWYLVHPAMAGAGQGGKVRGTWRKQWFDAEQAPNLQTLNAHMRLNTRSGAGVIFMNDANGYHSQTGFKLTYAHHLRFSRDARDLHQLSFGLSAGFIQSRLDESEFFSVVPDPVIGDGGLQAAYFNVDAGISYHYLEFFSHFSIRNLLGSGRDLYTAQEFDNLRRYLFSLGYVFGKKRWQWEPSMLFQYAEFTGETTGDINLKVYRDLSQMSLWAGISYRKSLEDVGQGELENTYGRGLDLMTALLGFNWGNFMFGYTYSYQTGNAVFDAGGFHQLTIGYDFLKEERPYECNCPAVNY